MSSNKAKLAFIKALGKATGDEQRISHDLAVLGVEALQKEALEARFEENEVRYLMPKDQGIDKYEQSEFDKISEYIFLGLRMVDGIDLAEFKNRFSKSIYEVFEKQIENNIHRGTMIIKTDRLSIPKKYLYVSNAILVDFV